MVFIILYIIIIISYQNYSKTLKSTATFQCFITFKSYFRFLSTISINIKCTIINNLTHEHQTLNSSSTTSFIEIIINSLYCCFLGFWNLIYSFFVFHVQQFSFFFCCMSKFLFNKTSKVFWHGAEKINRWYCQTEESIFLIKQHEAVKFKRD